MLPGLIPVVDEHYASMRELEAIASLLLRRAWNRVDPDRIALSWLDEVSGVLEPFSRLQLLAAEEGATYTDGTLAAQNITAPPEVELVPSAFVGWASDGRPLESLLETPAAVALDKVEQGAPVGDALDAGRVSAERIARTQIADAGRVAAGVDVVARPNVGWVRMVNPPVCSRCLILAGRFYRWSDGFQRHPNCDCVHVATNVSAARREGLVDDPNAYFRALSVEQQDRLLGKAGAQAVRDGADMNQVVNARRGMRAASVFGQDTLITLEGTTRRGIAGQRLIAEGARLSGESAETVRRQGRSGVLTRTVTRQRVQIPRLMPESIYQYATSRADAVRLLRRFGYIV